MSEQRSYLLAEVGIFASMTAVLIGASMIHPGFGVMLAGLVIMAVCVAVLRE